MISKRIREVITAEGLTVSNFADKLGVNKYRLQAILSKRQKTPEDVIIKLVEVFNVNPTWLITGNGSTYFEINGSNKDETNYKYDVPMRLKNNWNKLNDKQQKELMERMDEMVEYKTMSEKYEIMSKEYLVVSQFVAKFTGIQSEKSSKVLSSSESSLNS